MSIVMYKTENDYYYAVEIGMPEHQVQFGEGESPTEAINNLSGTQYQSADFGCRGPANSKLGDYFELGHDDSIIDCSADEESEAQEAYEGQRLSRRLA